MVHAAGTAFLGGMVAGSSLLAAGDLSLDGSWPDSIVPASVVAPAIGAALAALAAGTLRGRAGVGAVAAIGIALLAAYALDAPEPWVPWLAAGGAGLLLGALAALTDRVLVSAALTAGVLGGIFLGPFPWRLPNDLPRRYADYLAEEPFAPEWLALGLLAAVAALLALWLRRLESRPAHTTAAAGQRAILVGVLLPLVALAAQQAHASATGSYAFPAHGSGLWVYAAFLVAAVLVAALWLPGRAGAVLVAAAATSWTATDSTLPWDPDSALELSPFVALAVVGVLLGWWLRRPMAGMAVLVVVAVLGALDFAAADGFLSVAIVMLLPLALAYTLAASLPAPPAALVTALAAPICLGTPIVEYAWTSYAPLTSDPERAVDAHIPSLDLGALSDWAPVVLVTACATAMAWLQRRPASMPGSRPEPAAD